jgi:hypothetical protein
MAVFALVTSVTLEPVNLIRRRPLRHRCSISSSMRRARAELAGERYAGR